MMDADGKGDTLIVPICSDHPKADKTCTLKPSDGREFIEHNSYAGYYQAKIYPFKNIAKKIEDGTIKHCGECSAPVVTRIEAGITVSEETEPMIKDYYEKRKRPAPVRRILRKQDD
jgi:hypothetical protein